MKRLFFMTKHSSQRIQQVIGQRVRHLREAAGWTQSDLSERMGFKDRQTLSTIEAGQRRVTADELVTLMELFDRDIDFFSDPTLLVGEGAISWRADSRIKHSLLDDQEPHIRELVGLYRHLSREAGHSFPVLVEQLPLDRRSSFERAAALAEQLVCEWELGSIPSRKLRAKCEERLNLLTFYLDLPPGISGAALRLPELGAVAINRNESPGRKQFDFAHEVFHLLTWQTLPPERIDDMRGQGVKARRVEQLANTFASALLMPEIAVRRAWSMRSKPADVFDWFDQTAVTFQVSGQALFYRMKNLGFEIPELEESKLSNLGFREQAEEDKLYPDRFVEVLHSALEHGRMSVRRMARSLKCSADELAALFHAYGKRSPFDF